ncbi:MAG: DUF86 domain-containing protein [Methanobrevibacter sp.]|jgi:uncharacterized protein with HEPN domain|nr:DUF86 domain-containing protein [Methanobrevibacter sp.]
MKRDWEDFIKDILDEIENILEFVEDMNYDDFFQDNKTIYAVIRSIEIMGEAVKNIPYEIQEKYFEIPWSQMAKMRDKLIHGYFNINHLRVWETVTNEIPPLQPLFKQIFDEYK